MLRQTLFKDRKVWDRYYDEKYSAVPSLIENETLLTRNVSPQTPAIAPRRVDPVKNPFIKVRDAFSIREDDKASKMDAIEYHTVRWTHERFIQIGKLGVLGRRCLAGEKAIEHYEWISLPLVRRRHVVCPPEYDGKRSRLLWTGSADQKLGELDGDHRMSCHGVFRDTVDCRLSLSVEPLSCFVENGVR